jgi:hypothetical protein
VQLLTWNRAAPVEGRESQGSGRQLGSEDLYDLLLLVALRHLAVPGHPDEPVLLRRDYRERFGRRTRRSTRLLAVGGCLSK